MCQLLISICGEVIPVLFITFGSEFLSESEFLMISKIDSCSYL